MLNDRYQYLACPTLAIRERQEMAEDRTGATGTSNTVGRVTSVVFPKLLFWRQSSCAKLS
jgi:hypothetical protein